MSEGIKTGDKVRITLKPNDYYKKPLVGIVKVKRLVIDNGDIEADLLLAFTEDNEEHSNDIDCINVKDIEKIELLKTAPESLIEIIQTTDIEKEPDLFKSTMRLLKAYY